MVTAVPPVQIGSVGVIEHVAIRVEQPASVGVAVHCAMVTAMPPVQIGSVGVAVQVAMMSTQVEVAAFQTMGATQLPTV